MMSRFGSDGGVEARTGACHVKETAFSLHDTSSHVKETAFSLHEERRELMLP